MFFQQHSLTSSTAPISGHSVSLIILRAYCAHPSIFVRPLDPKLNLFLAIRPLMLDRKLRLHRQIDTLVHNLNLEPLAGFQRIRQTAQLRNILGNRVSATE